MRYLVLLLWLGLSMPVFAQTGAKKITLEDIWKTNTFRIRSVPGFTAMNDGLRYTRMDSDSGSQRLNVYELQSGQRSQTLFDNKNLTLDGSPIRVENYSFSKDEDKLLLLSEGHNVYRRSVLYKTYIYDITRKTLVLLDTSRVLHPTFSPDGSQIAYVKDNNLFVHDVASGSTRAITTDGERNRVINGNCDWVYEEEFEFTKAFEWSPDGRYLAFYRFDESRVPQFTMTVYDSLYPTPYTFKYPKAGDPNSVVSIRIHDLQSGHTADAFLGQETDQYIPRIKWTQDPAGLCIYRLNRLQNKLELLLANAANGQTAVIYTETNPYYIEINENLEFLPDGRSFIFNSEQHGNNHLYRYDWRSKKLSRLTKGNYDVDQLLGIDHERGLVYYTAAETSPLERHMYVVDWRGKNKRKLTSGAGTHAITPVKGYKFFLDKYSRINQPPVYVLLDQQGKVVRRLEDNKALSDKMAEYNLGHTQLIEVPGAQGQKLHAWMITPPDFTNAKRYPVLMYQYSGPGSQMVADRFPVGDFFWHQMLAQQGYIILCVDGTGTGFRGQEFKKKTYLQLGRYESDDQIAVGRYMKYQNFVDSNRIGIWGWSYGGFMSATCLFKGADVFKTAISVAPVTNWRYYDNIYTERYMRRPQENASGYDDNSPISMVAKMKGNLLLVHGTGDDNVHVQNSMMLINEMVRLNKDFDSEMYPNRNHGIGGGNTRLHLYRRMTEFILQNL